MVFVFVAKELTSKYLVVLGVSCTLQGLLLQHMDSLVVAHGLNSCSVQTQLF